METGNGFNWPESQSNRLANADKSRPLRVLCLAFIVGGMVLIVGPASVVYFALGGGPLVKGPNANVLLGVGAVVTLSAVVAATLLAPLVLRAGLKRTAFEVPEPPDEGAQPDTEADRLFRVYAQGKFTEYALAEGAAVLTAVLYHLSAHPLMLVFVGGMVLYMAMRFPTAGRVLGWMRFAAGEVDRMKGGSGEPAT